MLYHAMISKCFIKVAYAATINTSYHIYHNKYMNFADMSLDWDAVTIDDNDKGSSCIKTWYSWYLSRVVLWELWWGHQMETFFHQENNLSSLRHLSINVYALADAIKLNSVR